MALQHSQGDSVFPVGVTHSDITDPQSVVLLSLSPLSEDGKRGPAVRPSIGAVRKGNTLKISIISDRRSVVEIIPPIMVINKGTVPIIVNDKVMLRENGEFPRDAAACMIDENFGEGKIVKNNGEKGSSDDVGSGMSSTDASVATTTTVIPPSSSAVNIDVDSVTINGVSMSELRDGAITLVPFDDGGRFAGECTGENPPPGFSTSSSDAPKPNAAVSQEVNGGSLSHSLSLSSSAAAARLAAEEARQREISSLPHLIARRTGHTIAVFPAIIIENLTHFPLYFGTLTDNKVISVKKFERRPISWCFSHDFSYGIKLGRKESESYEEEPSFSSNQQGKKERIIWCDAPIVFHDGGEERERERDRSLKRDTKADKERESERDHGSERERELPRRERDIDLKGGKMRVRVIGLCDEGVTSGNWDQEGGGWKGMKGPVTVRISCTAIVHNR